MDKIPPNSDILQAPAQEPSAELIAHWEVEGENSRADQDRVVSLWLSQLPIEDYILRREHIARGRRRPVEELDELYRPAPALKKEHVLAMTDLEWLANRKELSKAWGWPLKIMDKWRDTQAEKSKGAATQRRNRPVTALVAGSDGLPDRYTIKSASEAAADSTFPRKDADALEAALVSLGVTFRYNLRAMQAEIATDGGPWTKTTDRSNADLRRMIETKFSYRLARGKDIAPLRFGAESFTEHLNALLHHLEVDPFQVWLESLPEWDGAERLAKLLPECLGALDDPLTQWAGTYLTLGAVQRTYDPGGLLREIPILIGPQRAGKSQLLSNLLPPEHPDWFSDSVCVSDPTQKRVEGMLGRVIVELSELTGFRRAELESLKAFISRRDDGATRLAYRRDPETALRRCIIVGTSNDVECLPNDPSGNTRFVPIQCGEGSHVEPYLDEHRVQLWAEGLALYNTGERANLPRDLMGLQAEHGEIHRRKDSIIEDAVAGIRGDGPFTIEQICRSTSMDNKDARRLGDALRLAGWIKKRERAINGSRVYMWRKP